MSWLQRIGRRPFFIRLRHWEYWSFTAVYCWLYPVWLLLCLRARSFFFFAAANPRIRNGGFLNESKQELAAMIPARYHPATVFFDLPVNADFVFQELRRHRLDYPLIGKPNIGGRGRGVKLLQNDRELRAYVQGVCLDFHIQEWVPWKNEVGIFYCRYPNEARGRITGIVGKEFLSVMGNGRDTLRELLQQDQRAVMYMHSWEKIFGVALARVPEAGEPQLISPYGNHARGARFLDHSHLADEELTDMIDQLCQQLPEFYYGRLDIRFHTWDELKKGCNFAVIEVNGAGAEPTHIYDPGHSLFFAWKEIVRHWVMLCRISRLNHRRGHRYLTWHEGIAMWRENKYWSERLAAMSET